MMTEDELTLGSRHTMKYADHVLQKSTLETYIALLINVIPNTFNLKKICANK